MQFVMNLNFMGTLRPSQVFGKVLAEQKNGSIINISSMAGLRPLTRVGGYGAAKAAVSNFTQWLATWFAQNISPEIRVNAIAPGFLLTHQNHYLLVDKDTGESTPPGRSYPAADPHGPLWKTRGTGGSHCISVDPGFFLHHRDRAAHRRRILHLRHLTVWQYWPSSAAHRPPRPWSAAPTGAF